MNELSAMIWVEARKAVRSGMPVWTALGSLFMPLGIAFLIYVARNPEIAKQLGLISAKANLFAYSATDWQAYLVLCAQIVSAGGFVLSVLCISWIFGREFSDGTLKDILAVPVSRASILLAKFIVAAVWSLLLTGVIFLFSLLMGMLIRLPGGSPEAILQGSILVAITAGLIIPAALPYAFFASLGRGYLLPVGLVILTLMMTNMVAIAGWGEYFPWAVPGLFAQGKNTLPAASYWIVCLTGLLGMFVTYLWWKNADQSR